MRVLNLRPITPGGGGRFPAVAVFDLEVTADLRLTGWTLRRAPRGDYIVCPPNARGVRAATFTPAFAAPVVTAAAAAFLELSDHDARIQ